MNELLKLYPILIFLPQLETLHTLGHEFFSDSVAYKLLGIQLLEFHNSRICNLESNV